MHTLSGAKAEKAPYFVAPQGAGAELGKGRLLPGGGQLGGDGSQGLRVRRTFADEDLEDRTDPLGLAPRHGLHSG
jgi:hypothetical protein